MYSRNEFCCTGHVIISINVYACVLMESLICKWKSEPRDQKEVQDNEKSIVKQYSRFDLVSSIVQCATLL